MCVCVCVYVCVCVPGQHVHVYVQGYVCVHVCLCKDMCLQGHSMAEHPEGMLFWHHTFPDLVYIFHIYLLY